MYTNIYIKYILILLIIRHPCFPSPITQPPNFLTSSWSYIPLFQTEMFICDLVWVPTWESAYNTCILFFSWCRVRCMTALGGIYHVSVGLGWYMGAHFAMLSAAGTSIERAKAISKQMYTHACVTRIAYNSQHSGP